MDDKFDVTVWIIHNIFAHRHPTHGLSICTYHFLHAFSN